MRRHENRLRDLREDRDLTQAEVAKIFFLQVTQYRRYENGESDIPLALVAPHRKKFPYRQNIL